MEGKPFQHEAFLYYRGTFFYYFTFLLHIYNSTSNYTAITDSISHLRVLLSFSLHKTLFSISLPTPTLRTPPFLLPLSSTPENVRGLCGDPPRPAVSAARPPLHHNWIHLQVSGRRAVPRPCSLPRAIPIYF